MNHGAKPKVSKDNYIVEKIDGVKMEDGQLKFFVKWEGYHLSESTFEVYENVKHCIVFQKYIDNFRGHLANEIEHNEKRMRSKLRDDIVATLTTKPKEEIIESLAKLEEFGYDAYEVMFHVLPPNEAFYKLFEELFQLNFFSQLLDYQEKQFRAFVLEVNKDEPMTLQVENDIDFSVFQSFKYINQNIWVNEPVIEQSGVSPGNFPKSHIDLDFKQPLTLFKTFNQGWGVKAMTKISAGQVIFECCGEVLPMNIAQALDDKKYLFPHPILTGDQGFMVNAATYGNLSRFVNHRCESNSIIYSTVDKPLKNQLFIVAKRDIAAGEEITINYSEHGGCLQYGIDCLCNSGKCLEKF